MTDIVERLLNWCIDWNGAQMACGEPPRDGLHCDDLLDAAAEIARLRAAWKDAEDRAELYANSRPSSERRDISTAPVIAQRDDRETIARILVPHWLGGFENQERVDTPDASGWRSWKNPPFTPNARAYAIADEILAALSMPLSAPPQRNEVKL